MSRCWLLLLLIGCRPVAESCPLPEQSRCTANRVQICTGQYWGEGTACAEVTPTTLRWTCCWSVREQVHACVPATMCVDGQEQPVPSISGGSP